MPRTFLALCAFAIALPEVALDLAAPPARAQDEEQVRARAAELYENGSRLYDEGLYEEAIVAFRASYDLSKEPVLFFNIASAYERLGDPEEAIKALNQYRPYAAAEERVSLERRLRALEERIAARKKADAEATPVIVAEPSVQPPTAPAEPQVQRRSWVLPAIGGGLLVAGGLVAGVTYAQSRAILDQEDEDAWNRLRPVNNAGFVVAGVGAATTTIGLAIPLGGKKTGSRRGLFRR